MSHEVEVSGNAVIATVPGALDGEAARALSSALRGKSFPGATVIIDMSGVTSVDVEGITQIVALKRWAERENGKLVLAAPSYEVMDALRSNGLDRIFETAPTRDEALAATGSSASAPSMPAIPTDPEPFHPTSAPVRREPEEPVRRREADEGEQGAWVMPDNKGAARQAPPPVAVAPPQPQHQVVKKKKSAAPLIIILLLLLGGGGAAYWYFVLNKKPEILPQEGDWTRVEGSDTEFDIKFRNAASVFVKEEQQLPDGLYLDTAIRDVGNDTKAQTVKGDTRKVGEHSFTAFAKAEGGAESPPQKYTFKITAEEPRDTSSGKPRELTENLPLVAGVQELARGCIKATAKGLDGSGLSVKVDANRRVAMLEGTPLKDGTVKFTVDVENADAKAKSFSYSVVIKPDPRKLLAGDPGKKDPGKTDPGKTDPGKTDPGKTDPGKTDPGKTDPGKTDPGKTDPGKTDPGKTDPGKTDPGKTDPGKTDPGKIVDKPPPPPPPPVLDPTMMSMLLDRIDKSRFPEPDKEQMRAAVNQVESARKLWTVKFGHGEKSLSSDEREKLRAALREAPEVEKGQHQNTDFVVVGYASQTGTLAQNISISKARASSVESVLKAPEFGIQSKFTGYYGATNVLGPSDDDNRVVEVYAVRMKEETKKILQKLVEDMKRISGS